eukprot:358258-Chlamydomonas_euryale.AAC.3
MHQSMRDPPSIPLVKCTSKTLCMWLSASLNVPLSIGSLHWLSALALHVALCIGSLHWLSAYGSLHVALCIASLNVPLSIGSLHWLSAYGSLHWLSELRRPLLLVLLTASVRCPLWRVGGGQRACQRRELCGFVTGGLASSTAGGRGAVPGSAGVDVCAAGGASAGACAAGAYVQ